MKIKQTYVAYDDTEFDRADDCVIYELKQLDIIKGILQKTTFYYRDKKKITVATPVSIDGIEDAFCDLEKVYDDCHYIDIHEVLNDDEYEWFITNLGINIPIETGEFHYDYDTGECAWEEKDVKQFKKQKYLYL